MKKLSIGLVQATNVDQINGNNNNIVFIDVKENYWAINKIKYFVSQNIILGNNNRRIKEKLKGLTPVQHRFQAISVA